MQRLPLRRLLIVPLILFLAAACAAPGAGRLSVSAQTGITVPAGPDSSTPATQRYRVDLLLDPARPRAGVPGIATVMVFPLDGHPFPSTGDAGTTFTLVSRNLEEFVSFENPSREPATDGPLQGARFTFPVTFASGGAYCLITEFSDRGSRVARFIEIPVEGPRQKRTRWNFGRVRKVAGIRAVLRADPLRSPSIEDILVDVELTEGGLPVTDLEPLHGAWGRILAFRDGLQSPALISGDTRRRLDDIAAGRPAPRGPKVWFRHQFPTDDKYRLWVQVRRGGTTLTFPFDVWVEPPPEELHHRHD